MVFHDGNMSMCLCREEFMIDEDYVLWSYRLILGREPESAEVVTRYARELADAEALRRLFFNSTEFRERWSQLALPRASKPAFVGPPMPVETKASAEDLARMFARVTGQWEALGESEPHWSVITQEQFLQERLSEEEVAAFYASGRGEVQQLAALVQRCGRQLDEFASCFELGCGVGRVTAALAERFREVHAWDVSASHLVLAREWVSAAQYPGVVFGHIDTLARFEALPAFDFFYSRIVLQHNPPPLIGFMLERILQRLSPKGLAVFQVPTYKAGYRFEVARYLAHEGELPAMEMHFFPQAELFALAGRCGCVVREVREDDSIGVSATAVSNTFVLEKTA